MNYYKIWYKAHTCDSNHLGMLRVSCTDINFQWWVRSIAWSFKPDGFWCFKVSGLESRTGSTKPCWNSSCLARVLGEIDSPDCIGDSEGWEDLGIAGLGWGGGEVCEVTIDKGLKTCFLRPLTPLTGAEPYKSFFSNSGWYQWFNAYRNMTKLHCELFSKGLNAKSKLGIVQTKQNLK